MMIVSSESITSATRNIAQRRAMITKTSLRPLRGCSSASDLSLALWLDWGMSGWRSDDADFVASSWTIPMIESRLKNEMKK